MKAFRKYIRLKGFVLLIVLFYACEKENPLSEKKDLVGPEVNLTIRPVSGKAPLEVYFSVNVNAGDGYITSRKWDFGEGKEPGWYYADKTHFYFTYKDQGVYTAKYTVTDENGLSASDSKTITVDEPIRWFSSKTGSYCIYAVEDVWGSSSSGNTTKTYDITAKVESYDAATKISKLKITGQPADDKTILSTVYIKETQGKLENSKSASGPWKTILVASTSSAWSYSRFLFPDNEAIYKTGSLLVEIPSGASGKESVSGWYISRNENNWGLQYQTERYEYTYAETYAPLVGLVKSRFTYYSDDLTCFTCSVYTGSLTITLKSFSVYDSKGVLHSGGQ